MERSVVTFVVKRLGDYVTEEVRLVRNLRRQIERLKTELVFIHGFLKDAHGACFEHFADRIWVADVRDIAYDVDDLLDDFLLKIESRRRRAQGFFRIFNIYKKHRIGEELETIFQNLEDIAKRKRNYSGLSLQPSPDDRSWRRVYAHVEDGDIVGLDEMIDRVVGEVLKEESFHVVSIVSICGMGGLGKSTLAKAVYNRVKSQFDCCAWFFVSERYQTEETLRQLLRQVSQTTSPEWEKMSEPQLVETLYTTLEQKHYLVVLDDIWSLDFWSKVKSAFPTGTRGSKVMFTTRNKKIAKEADSRSRTFVPQFLSDDDAWDLLRKKVFPRAATGSSWGLTDDLMDCGKAMVKKCGGLPLAIIALAKKLAAKITLHAWEKVSKDISLHIYGGENGVFTILEMSYIDLPFHLKPLFLYMGLYLEHREIRVKVLIKMWYGECLAYRYEDEHQAVMAMQFIEELIDRCVVLERTRNSEGGAAKTCELHVSMREFCIFKATEENFLRILGKSVFPFEASSLKSYQSTKIRRCAIIVKEEMYDFPRQQFKPRLRTGIFSMAGESIDLVLKQEDFKLVKVLEFTQLSFKDVKLEKRFYNVIVLLANLRYLGIRKTAIKKLPESLGSLVHLETLDARSTFPDFSFPDVICKLTSLKHFYISNHDHLTGMHRLVKLRILSSIRGDLWTPEMIELVHLEKLGIVDVKSETLKLVISSVTKEFANLRSLSLSMSNTMSFPSNVEPSNVESLSQKCGLEKLSLNGKMASFPTKWPTNLIKLQLLHSSVKKDPMPILENLKYLAHLSLNNAFVGEEMVCSSDGFPKLQYLEIKNLPGLVIWIVETGAVQNLQTCIINKCSLLHAVPHGFHFVRTLENLVIRNMPPVFCARVQPGGDDWNSVNHISSVKTE